MALPITVPYTFGNATTAIPLSNLDSDYATVYQAVNGIGNGSVALANVTITGGTVSNVSGVVPTPFTANGVVYASSTSALATGSALTFNGSATTPLVKVAGTSTNASSQDFTTNSAAQRTTIGVEQSAGGGLFSGSSAYAAVFGSAGASNTQFATNNTVQMTLDTSGNLGLGVTPFTWASGWKAFQIGAYGNFSALSNQINLSTNAYYSAASSWIYQNTNPATNYAQVGGQHIWQNAASGTATNAISFINAMTLDASGNLIVGGTSALGNTTNRGNITLNGTSSAFYSFGVGGVLKGFLNHGGTDLELQNSANGILSFSTNGTERTRIDSSGNLLIGYTSSNGAYKLQVNSQIFATSAIIATSDARYKTNVTPISNGLSLVNKLNPVSFDWKEHSVHNFDTKNTNVGFLAQDVQEVLKNEIYLNSVIRKNETELPDGTKEEFLGLSDSSLIPILVKAIQELTTRLTVLENK